MMQRLYLFIISAALVAVSVQAAAQETHVRPQFCSSGAGAKMTDNGWDVCIASIFCQDDGTDCPLLTELSGTLSVGNGGTGATSLLANGVLVGNGTGAITATATGNDNHYLASNGGTPVFQVLDASDIGAGLVAKDRGGMGSVIGGDTPGVGDCIFFYDADQASNAEKYRFACHGSNDTNDYAWVFTGQEWIELEANANGDVLSKASGNLVFDQLDATSLNGDLGDFDCDGTAQGCTLAANSVGTNEIVTNGVGALEIQQNVAGDNELVCVGASDDWCFKHDTARNIETGTVVDVTIFESDLHTEATIFAEADLQFAASDIDAQRWVEPYNDKATNWMVKAQHTTDDTSTNYRFTLLEYIEVPAWFTSSVVPFIMWREVGSAQTTGGYQYVHLLQLGDQVNSGCTGSGTPYSCCTGSGTGTCDQGDGILTAEYHCTGTERDTQNGYYEKGTMVWKRTNGTYTCPDGTTCSLGHTVIASENTGTGSYVVRNVAGFGLGGIQVSGPGSVTTSWYCDTTFRLNAG